MNKIHIFLADGLFLYDELCYVELLDAKGDVESRIVVHQCLDECIDAFLLVLEEPVAVLHVSHFNIQDIPLTSCFFILLKSLRLRGRKNEYQNKLGNIHKVY